MDQKGTGTDVGGAGIVHERDHLFNERCTDVYWDSSFIFNALSCLFGFWS